VNALLAQAVKDGASDIHIEPLGARPRGALPHGRPPARRAGPAGTPRRDHRLARSAGHPEPTPRRCPERADSIPARVSSSRWRGS
jgi:hypothetical protein